MSSRKFVSQEEIVFARQLDLLSYLETYRPDELVKISDGVYSMRSHGSLKLSNGKWFRWSRGYGGVSALDYLVNVENMPFVEAVQYMCGCARYAAPRSIPDRLPKQREFVLPQKNKDNDRVINYLIQRGLSPDVINRCIENESLFEDVRHNCCFVGKDEQGIARYATLRGTSPHHTFLMDVAGSKKEYAFRLSAGNSSDLYLFESAIDLLSYFELSGQKDGVYLSVSGIYQPKANNAKNELPVAVSHYLSKNKGVKDITICFDNDTPGIKAAEAIGALLKTSYTVRLTPPEVGKDYNDLLLIRKGLPKTVKTRTKNNKEEIEK